MNRINGFISAVTGILVLFLTGASFVLSFHALADLVLASGVTSSRAWLYPAIVDGMLQPYTYALFFRAGFENFRSRNLYG